MVADLTEFHLALWSCLLKNSSSSRTQNPGCLVIFNIYTLKPLTHTCRPGPVCIKQLKIKWDFFATIPCVPKDFLVLSLCLLYSLICLQPSYPWYHARKSSRTKGMVAKKSLLILSCFMQLGPGGQCTELYVYIYAQLVNVLTLALPIIRFSSDSMHEQKCFTFYLIFSHCRKIRGRKRFPAVYGLTLTHAASHFSLVENTSISHKGNVGDRWKVM